MPRALVEAVEIGIRRGLLDDEDALAKAQQLVERDPPRADRSAAILSPTSGMLVTRRSSERVAPCSRAITARSPMFRSTTGPKLEWPGGARLAVWVIPNIEFFPLTRGIAGLSRRARRQPALGARLGATRLRQPGRHLAADGCAEQARHPRQPDTEQRHLRPPPADRPRRDRARLGDPRPQPDQQRVARHT